MNIVVYSAIFGGYDHFRPPLNMHEDVRYVLFTDKHLDRSAWEVIVVKPEYSRRKQARFHKILAHRHFPEADYTIWIDGWLQLIADPHVLLGFLDGNDIAMETHRERDCIYAEAEEVIRQHKVIKPEYAREQVRRYAIDGFPAHYGLTSTYMMVRRNTPGIAEMENLWWSEIDRHTLRDQLSFMYCMWKLDLACSRIPHGQGIFYHSYKHAGKSY